MDTVKRNMYQLLFDCRLALPSMSDLRPESAGCAGIGARESFARGPRRGDDSSRPVVACSTHKLGTRLLWPIAVESPRGVV